MPLLTRNKFLQHGHPRAPLRGDYHEDAPSANPLENLFAKIKDWRRIHTRYDRCAHTFMSAICIAATCCYWL